MRDMKKIACFAIPAHGHTNPMIQVVAELIKRGNTVRFYSFDEFEAKIESTGAEFISCDEFLPKLTKEESEVIKSVSTTEMTIQDIRITLLMDKFLDKEFESFKPDVVYTDSVCFWGKLNAIKHNVPMVVSTSTFAFNQWSSQYMASSPRELADMIFGLPRVSKELKKLEAYGYKIKRALDLVQSDNNTDSIVYTSKRFQPYSESFSEHYAFVGPSISSSLMPQKEKERPLVYISMGTVVNNRPDFYSRCISALKDMDLDVIISCGNSIDIKRLGNLDDNIKVFPYVNQLEVLSRADVFITHCGMNSVSESLYMATPMVLYPQTNEQKAVARRVMEIGAGIKLVDDSANGIRNAICNILNSETYTYGAEKCRDDFLSCKGTAGAAEFILSAPHTAKECKVVERLNHASKRFKVMYWIIAIALILLSGFLSHWKCTWIFAILSGVLSYPIYSRYQRALAKKWLSGESDEQ